MFSKSEARGASKKPRSKAAIAAAHPGITKPLVTKAELGAVLNVSPRTIENWMRKRRIPYLKIGARTRRFSLTRVEEALSRFEIREVRG